MAVGLTPSALGQMPTTSAPAQPFVWGQGGKRMTPEQIERERQIAASLSQVDYSPIQSPWQGLARVAGNAVGALRDSRANKAAEANTADSQRIAQLLLGAQTAPGAPPMSPAGEVPAAGGAPMSGVAEALSSPYVDDATRQLATMVYKQQHREPTAPHYWERNDGSLAILTDPRGDPRVIQDPTPKITWITADDPATGQKTIIPVGPNGPLSAMPNMGGGGPASAGPGGASPPATLPPDFDGFDAGGPTQPAPGTFR